MDTSTIIISGVILLLIFDVYFIYHIRKKRQGSFKLVIDKGIIKENKGHVPAEFLYDVQQLARINKPESLIINGSGITGSEPKLKFRGNISTELQEKFENSLTLSLQ